MSEFSFIHAADLHLDAPFRGMRGALSSAKADQELANLLRQATFIALERLVDLCLRENTDFLVLAGDIYTSTDGSLKARMALRDAFLRLQAAGIAVFIVHGNHDPYTKDDGVIPWPDNVTVFGGGAQSVPVYRRGEAQADPQRVPLALVHGISHTHGKEARNLAAMLKVDRGSLFDVAPFHIGLLHCALAGYSGAHEAYAPCSFSDLSSSGMDYWALGHIHVPRFFNKDGKEIQKGQERALLSAIDSGTEGDVPDASRKYADMMRLFAAYPGSLQGLHVNLFGPHGCLVVTVETAEGAPRECQARFVPLAPLRFEQCALEPGPDVDTVPALEASILGHLESFAPDPGQAEPPLAVLVRLTLTGRSPLHSLLHKQGALADLEERLIADLAGTGVWIRDIRLETRPFLDMDAMAARADLAGESLRLASLLREKTPQLEAFAQEALEGLFKNKRARKTIPAPDAAELARLMEEAAFLCVDMLSPEDADSAGEDA